MQKKELRSLKRINATAKMVELAKNNHKRMKYKSDYGRSIEMDTVYDLLVRCQTRGKILMVCVFLPEEIEKGKLTPAYEIYCNPEGNEYITRIVEAGQQEKWSNAMADNIGKIYNRINFYYYRTYKQEKRIWQNEEGKETIRQFLGTEKKGLFGLIEWERKTHDWRVKEAERREKEPWDRDMELVPEIVPSFRDWMLKEAPSQYFIFYEYSRKGATEGYCSHCHKMVPISRPKHNKESRCRACGVKVRYKVSSKIQTLTTGDYSAQIIQKMKQGIVIREYVQSQWYRECDYREPKSYMHEEKRILLMDDGTVKRYYMGLYKNREHRWVLDKNYNPNISTYYHMRTVKFYNRNLKSLKKTVLKNSAIDLWDELPTDVANYITIEKVNPAVEMLARVGMFKLAEDLMKCRYDKNLLNQNATELTKILKIDAARMKRLKKMDGKVSHLRWMQYEKMANTIWPDEMIKDFGDNGFHTSSEFGFLPLPLMSYVKIWNYLKKQCEIIGESMARVKSTWMDYVNMAEKAKMDVKNDQILKPKDLKAAHTKVVMILQNGEMEKEAKKLEKKWPKVNENVKKLKKFEYSDGKFSILAPAGILDIVKEGTALRHCVHTCDYYFDRIQRDETYLFFLRRAERQDVPWYTLEVEPSGNIRQKRTTGDNQNKDFEEAVKFLKKWQKEFKKRMTEEEKKLGEMADRMRIQEYAKLREDGNRIWHGKLAGKLLVDVLEEDFMEAI